MKLSMIKPISYFKSHAAEILRTMAEDRQPMIITQNGEAQAVLQDIASYEETQETLALLKILALGEQQIKEGKTTDAFEFLDNLRKQNQARVKQEL